MWVQDSKPAACWLRVIKGDHLLPDGPDFRKHLLVVLPDGVPSDVDLRQGVVLIFAFHVVDCFEGLPEADNIQQNVWPLVGLL